VLTASGREKKTGREKEGNRNTEEGTGLIVAEELKKMRTFISEQEEADKWKRGRKGLQ